LAILRVGKADPQVRCTDSGGVPAKMAGMVGETGTHRTPETGDDARALHLDKVNGSIMAPSGRVV
jgi:hypothetical protein